MKGCWDWLTIKSGVGGCQDTKIRQQIGWYGEWVIEPYCRKSPDRLGPPARGSSSTNRLVQKSRQNTYALPACSRRRPRQTSAGL